MPIDPLGSDTFPLTEAARRIPRLRNDRRVSVSTLWRWAFRGLRGVRLETTLIGGVRVTSAEALRQFFAALNCPSRSDEPSPGRQEKAASELDRIGIRS